MANPQKSAAALTRLPQYYRVLRGFLQQGIYRCSSEEIAAQTEYSPTAVRSDLRRFSGCAKQGYGYHVKQLYTALGSYLGVLDEFRAVLIGKGAAAQIVCRHPLIAVHGIRLCAVFSDLTPEAAAAEGFDPSLCFTDLSLLGDVCADRGATLLLLTESVPAEVLDRAVAGGIRGIWSLSEARIPPRADVVIRELHPFDSLISLCCELKQENSSLTKE